MIPEGITPEAADFLTKSLIKVRFLSVLRVLQSFELPTKFCQDPDLRETAEQLLKHEWIVSHKEAQEVISLHTA